MARINPRYSSFIRAAWALIYPYWLSAQWKIAWILLVTIVGLNLGLVYVSVLFNTWYGSFYNSLQQKNYDDFKRLIVEFGVLAGIYIIGAVYRLYLQQMLMIKWRAWLTDDFLSKWLAKKRFYSMELFKLGTDNPDQRIADDLHSLSSSTLSLSLGFLSSVTTLVSFFMILWALSGPISFTLMQQEITIPGYMVWVAFAYAAVGSICTHFIGRRLISLNFSQQKAEADFRFALIRTRENADAIALAGGESQEAMTLRETFSHIISNWTLIMSYQKRLTWFTAAYSQAAVIFPMVVGAPRYFSGAVELGVLIQISKAFGEVQGSLSWFIDSYSGLTEWKASVDRILGFLNAANTSDAHREVAERDLKIVKTSNAPEIKGVIDIALPSGRALKNRFTFSFDHQDGIKSGTLIQGRSGSGKSTFFRVLAGLWPFAKGDIQVPSSKEMLFLPQRPYIPRASLRDACQYPQARPDVTDDQLVEYFKFLDLPLSKQDLSVVDDWSKRLSLGEQQRLVLIRAAIARPKWLFLDEAMASLDSESEVKAREFLKINLPQTDIIEISHDGDQNGSGMDRIEF